MSKRTEFINVAKSQIGIRENGTNNIKYNTWYYGKTVNGRAGTSEYAWCVTFECWCANQVGILNTLIPKCNNVGDLKNWYNSKGLYLLRGTYTPQNGDLIIFKNASHTGIVEKVINGRVYTIEGNSSDKVSNNSYLLTDTYIQGYCKIKFDNNTSTSSKTNKDTIKKIQKKLNTRYAFNLAIDGEAKTKTFIAFRKALQIELNKQFKAGLTVDGNIGPKTKAKLPIVRKGAKGNITWLIQAVLISIGYNIGLDSDYGKETAGTVKVFQTNNGLKDDGECGKNTFTKLFNKY